MARRDSWNFGAVPACAEKRRRLSATCCWRLRTGVSAGWAAIAFKCRCRLPRRRRVACISAVKSGNVPTARSARIYWAAYWRVNVCAVGVSAERASCNSGICPAASCVISGRGVGSLLPLRRVTAHGASFATAALLALLPFGGASTWHSGDARHAFRWRLFFCKHVPCAYQPLT